MAQQRDPFYIVKDEVSETMRAVQAKYSKWQNLLRTNPDRGTLQQELGDDCAILQYMVDEIGKSIDAAEKNPQRFKLSQQELSDRRKWVMSMRRQLEAVLGGVQAGANGSASSSTAAPGPASVASKLAAAAFQENERFIQSEGDRQQLLMRRQDDELDQLSSHVVRIGELGKEMGQELHVQGQLLDELDQEIDGTQGRLAAAQRKVEYVLQKAGFKGQLMLIVGLIVLLVILVLLVFS